MSFYTNNKNLATITFNTNDVKTVYFNNELVWEKGYWPGLADATWEDVYNLCKQKQSGEISYWPEDVYVGAVKSGIWRDTYSLLGYVGIDFVIIGLDIDGEGVITFQCKEGMLYSHITDKDNWDSWMKEIPQSVCDTFYSNLIRPNKEYIKPLAKGIGESATGVSSRIMPPNFYTVNCWIPSEFEVGLNKYSVSGNALTKEATQGVSKPYPYFTDNTSRIKETTNSIYTGTGGDIVDMGVQPWYLRSLYFAEEGAAKPTGFCIVSSTGEADYTGYGVTSAGAGIAPCFAIG